MDVIILDSIRFQVNVEGLFQRIHIDTRSQDAEQVMNLVRKAEEIGRPKVLYKQAYIDNRGEGYVVIDGVKLTSRVLQVNLSDVYRVFPYITTCGRELHEWANTIEDILERYWADSIMEMALRAAVEAFHKHLEEKYHPGKLSAMNPGSLKDWPIGQQKELFRILGNKAESIGVELSESCLMMPIKSTSGILFPADVDFHSCQLCPREKCPGRRAPYDKHLYDEKYGI